MLHLFNKVYLEFDDRIENHLDRVVISEQYANQMYDILEKTFLGKLILYGKSFEEVVGDDFLGFIKLIKEYGDNSGKKIIIFCDRASYKKFMAHWFRSTLPNLDYDGFKTIVDHTIYNQRIVSNTQLSSLFSVNLNSLWKDLDDIESAWTNAQSVNRTSLKSLNLNHTYEFLLSTYLSGDNSHKEALKKTLHMFLRRWFIELFVDNRQAVLMNLNNHKFLSAFNIDPKLVDLTRLDPLDVIEQFESYSDDEIWERDENTYGECKLEGLSEEKCLKLMDTLYNVFEKFEGMQIDRSVFGIRKYVTLTTRESITDEEMDDILDFAINNTFDTSLVPRSDFQNVNFTLVQYFLSQKYNKKDISKYRLL
jgi:hypothetical protein